MVEISEVAGLAGDEIQLNPLFRFQECGTAEDGRILGGLKPTGNRLIRRAKWNKAGGQDEAHLEAAGLD